MRISDWGSDVCSSDLSDKAGQELAIPDAVGDPAGSRTARQWSSTSIIISPGSASISAPLQPNLPGSPPAAVTVPTAAPVITCRSDEHTSELQPLMRTSYAVSCL